MPTTRPTWNLAEELRDMLFGVDLATRSTHELVELRAALVKFTDQVDAHLPPHARADQAPRERGARRMMPSGRILFTCPHKGEHYEPSCSVCFPLRTLALSGQDGTPR